MMGLVCISLNQPPMPKCTQTNLPLSPILIILDGLQFVIPIWSQAEKLYDQFPVSARPLWEMSASQLNPAVEICGDRAV